LSHRIARKRIQHEKPRRQLVSREQLLGPGAKGREIEGIAVIQHVGQYLFQNYGRSDALAPLWIGHADHGTLGDRGMFAQRFLNLQRGYLVSARLEDVNVRPAKNAIDTVLDDRSIARAKPAIAEGSAGCNRLAVFSDKLNLDARQRPSDAARHALAP